MYSTTLEAFDGSTADMGSFPAESFSDWLGAVCMNVADPLLTAQRKGITAEDLAAWPAADVLALVMDEGQPDRSRLAALGALRIAFDAYTEQARKQDALRPLMGNPMAALRALGVRA
jgi:hypothetical protein